WLQHTVCVLLCSIVGNPGCGNATGHKNTWLYPGLLLSDLVPLVLITEKKTWRDALSYCRENHVDLVSVHTEEIQRRVEAVIKVASTDNVWIWSDGSNSPYRNWISGEPNSPEKDNCVELWSESEYRWNDAGCTYPSPFVCYKGDCEVPK
uniref:C-type lectin domain-containing protein n=1 Tax=Astyanax mexicanus TaxID=7994 RepID=A0A3B1IFI1_ASTMX